jgi:hypothetical protein
MADSRNKQIAIDQLTNALTTALSRFNTGASRVAGSGGGPPPPPSGGGHALDGSGEKPRDRPKNKEVTLTPAGSSGDNIPTSHKSRMDLPPPPPEDSGDSDEDSEGEESEDREDFE